MPLRRSESVNIIGTGGVVHDIAVSPSVPRGLYRGIEYTRAGALVRTPAGGILAPDAPIAGMKRGAAQISGAAAAAPSVRSSTAVDVLSEFVSQFESTGPLTFYVLATDGVRRVVKVRSRAVRGGAGRGGRRWYRGCVRVRRCQMRPIAQLARCLANNDPDRLGGIYSMPHEELYCMSLALASGGDADEVARTHSIGAAEVCFSFRLLLSCS